MGLGLLAATQKILGETDYPVRVSQVAIQRQRLLAFSNALVRTVHKKLEETHVHVGLRMLGVQGQSLDQGRLGHREARCPVIGSKVRPLVKFN